MTKGEFDQRKALLFEDYEYLVQRSNQPWDYDNGVYRRYKFPVLTARHTPIFWR